MGAWEDDASDFPCLLRRARIVARFFEQQKQVVVRYDGSVVGDSTADLLVGGKVILERKAAQALDSVHEAKMLNYLRASGLKVGLLLNFAEPRLEYKRMVLSC